MCKTEGNYDRLMKDCERHFNNVLNEKWCKN